MKKIEREVEVRVEHNKVVEVTCDMCGVTTKRVDSFSADWGSSEYTSLSASRFIDGEEFKDEAEICYECLSYLINPIERGIVKRPADWVNPR